METWAIVAIVLGTSLITNLLTWFLTNRQLTHFDKRLERQLQAQREENKRERQQAVRSEPLLKLRVELAHMAAKGERVVDLAKSTGYRTYLESEYQAWLKTEQVPNELTEALDDWNTYMASGEFQQVLFMQYDMELVNRVDAIRAKYNLARHGMKITDWFSWLDEEAKEKIFEDIDQRIREAIDVIIGNRERIAEVQSEINKLLEKL